MAEKQWVLTDTATSEHVDQLTVTAADLDGQQGEFRVEKRRLRGGLSEGVEEIRIHNGRLELSLLPTRGMNLWKAWLDGREFGWQSPVRGPVHPAFVPLAEPSGLGWLDGFDELLARCGLESNGAPEFDEQARLKYGLHGRISNRPAHRVELAIDSDSGRIRVTGTVDETRFLFSRLRLTTTFETQIGESGVRIYDRIENLGSTPALAQLLYHLNFGAPLLEGGARVVLPARKIVPRNPHSAAAINSWSEYSPPQVGFQEQVYFMQLHGGPGNATQVLLRNAAGDQGVSLFFSLDQLPCFTLWKNTAGLADGYVTGLEPGTNFPNPRSFETQHGRVVQLEPQASYAIDLKLEMHAEAGEVQRAQQAIEQLQAGREPELVAEPQTDWCA